MPKQNVPEDMETLATLAEVRTEVIYERLHEMLTEVEPLEATYADAKQNGISVDPGLREKALTAPHIRALIEQLEQDDPENARKVARLTVAADLAKDNEARANEMRLERDRMLQVLHLRYGHYKAELCREYDIRRGKLNKSFNTFNGVVPNLTEDEARAAADEFHTRYMRAISVEATARGVRDRLLAELERPSRGPIGQVGAGYTPAQLARASGISESRITQIRTGSANASRTRKSREVQKQKATAA